MLARSALITRWNSNQVPWIHRGNCIESRPMDPRLCIMLAHGSMVVHHAGPWIHGCAYFRPWDPWLCIMLARSALITRWNSNQVPWDPSRELHRVPARSSNHARTPWNRLRELHRVPAHGSKVVHHAGPVGVDHSMELQPGPLGSMVVHRVPARSSNHARPPWVDRGN
jgi:hypothetical protein